MNGITKHQVRNLSLLATCQALMMTASTLNVAATARWWDSCLPTNKALATLPFALLWLATTLTSVPAALLMRRVGRRAGLMTGVTAAVLGGSLG